MARSTVEQRIESARFETSYITVETKGETSWKNIWKLLFGTRTQTVPVRTDGLRVLVMLSPST